MERLTPFMIFYAETKASILAEHPDLQPVEVSRRVFSEWKNLHEAQARGYSVLSATYAMKKDTGKSPPVRRKRAREAKDPKAPKAATSAYMYYSKYQRTLLKKENTELSFGDLGKTVGAMWKAATAEERAPFEEEAAADKVRFNAAVAAYKEQVGEDPSSKSTSNQKTCIKEAMEEREEGGEDDEEDPTGDSDQISQQINASELLDIHSSPSATAR